MKVEHQQFLTKVSRIENGKERNPTLCFILIFLDLLNSRKEYQETCKKEEEQTFLFNFCLQSNTISTCSGNKRTQYNTKKK